MCCLSDKSTLAQAQCTSVYKKTISPARGCARGDGQYTVAATEKQVEGNYRVQNLYLQSASEQRLIWSLFKEIYSQVKLLSKTNMLITLRCN